MPQSLLGWLRVPGLLVLVVVAVAGLLPATANAQQPATLTGRVTGQEGQPLGSAGVIIEQLSAGAVTRPDGSYTIIVPGALASVQFFGPGYMPTYLATFAFVAILGGPLGEEIGWRGFALPRMQPLHVAVIYRTCTTRQRGSYGRV